MIIVINGEKVLAVISLFVTVHKSFGSDQLYLSFIGHHTCFPGVRWRELGVAPAIDRRRKENGRMQLRTILGTLTLLGAALTPVASAVPSAAEAASCVDERTGQSMTVRVTGSTGFDNLWAVTGDVISAQSGDDRIFLDQISDGPFGSDVVACGDGENDWIGFFLAQPTGTLAARGGTGADTLLGGSNSDFLNGNAGTDTLIGNDGDDTLKGEDGNDNIWGGDGNDVIDGGDGHDIIDGGPGRDTCKGGEERNFYTVNCEVFS
ncbi:hypothetical protein AGRA3207_000836 [Actinomadura graeca]|uniref:Calcium-binding protein n=1 Tax=Actinomadura graeca TaxID=2750812 RepID=A0ABX8QN74_9ACTN|nr:calcium-binding protein [Actinomadura graeca]QXJ20173.1 hypothetical protein AGRA3207_000836 [Actinomadura graeca]